MKRLFSVLLLIVITVFLTTSALAAEYNSAGNKFIFSESSSTSEKVGGDYIAFAQSIRLNAAVSGDVVAVGGDVTLKNPSAQNVMAVAQNVSIAVGTAKNVYVFGTFVDITSTGGINGAYLAGTSITLNGNATELYTDARTFRLNGVVSGNAVIRSDSIQFGENAAVGGTLTIYGSKKPQLPASVDQSKVIFHQVSAADQNMFQSTFRQLTGLFGFVGLLSTLLLAVLITLFKGGFIRDNALSFRQKSGWAVLWGFIAFIAVPIASIIAMVTLVGMSAAIIILLVYGIFLSLSPIIAGAVLGRLVFPKMNRYAAAIVGAAAVKLVIYLPVVGTLLYLACAFYVLGLVVMSLKPYREERETPINPGQ